jgi:hypothetical protein
MSLPFILSESCATPSPWVACVGTCAGVPATCQDCAAGWTHETAFFRRANCAQPTSYVSAFSAVVLLLCCLAQAVLLRKRGILSSKVVNSCSKRVFLSVQGLNASLVLAHVAMLAENRGGPAYWFFFGLGTLFTVIASSAMMEVFARLSFAAALQPFPESTFRAAFVLNISLFSVSSVMCFTAALVPDHFNTLLAVAYAWVPVNLLVVCPMMLVLTSRIIRQLQALSDGARDRVLRNIRHFRYGFYFVVGSDVAVAVLVAVSQLAWAWPYSWAYQVGTEVLMLFCVFLFALLLQASDSGSSSGRSRARGTYDKSSRDRSAVVDVAVPGDMSSTAASRSLSKMSSGAL